MVKQNITVVEQNYSKMKIRLVLFEPDGSWADYMTLQYQVYTNISAVNPWMNIGLPVPISKYIETDINVPCKITTQSLSIHKNNSIVIRVLLLLDGISESNNDVQGTIVESTCGSGADDEYNVLNL